MRSLEGNPGRQSIFSHWQTTDNPYDRVLYESSAFPQSHPDRLHTLAKMLGLNPAPVTGCRVLELGCASGGNIIPLAYHLPESKFVGIDLSQRQVKLAVELVDALELGNIQIHRASILDIDDAWGAFDYIVCHGVYSWVEAPVRDKILEVCRNNLTPQGVAYISYNTYPGWHLREMVRHMMLYHARQFDDPAEQIEQARALLDFLSESLGEQQSAYSRLLEDEVRLVRNAPDYYLFHDHLEEVNTPVYFHQFVRDAARHRLQYLADAELHTMLPSGFSAKTRETLERIGRGQVQREQYLDFLRNRTFRQSLLCHRERRLEPGLVPGRVEGLQVASQVAPLEQRPALAPGVPERYSTASGNRVETAEPITKAALLELGRSWPKAIGFDELYRLSRSRLEREGATGERGAAGHRSTLASDILWCFVSGVVELKSWEPDFATVPGPRPRVSRLNRLQALHGRPVVNHRHETVSPDPVAGALLPHLDGNHDRAALLNVLQEKIEAGSLELRGDVPRSPGQQREIFGAILDRALDNLAASALLCVEERRQPCP